MISALTLSERFLKLAARAPKTLVVAINNRPYGWGEYRDQIENWEPKLYYVRRGATNLAVECLLHLHTKRTAPMYVNFGGFTTPATLYGTLGRAVWERGLNAVMISLPGHGHTDLPPLQYRDYRQSAKIMYEAICQIRQEYGLTGPIRVLGHSHGAGVVQGLAAEVGDEISRNYLLAGVGGPEWTRLAKLFEQSLKNLRRGKLFTHDIADGWQRLSGFVSDGYIIIPPPWELAEWQAEMIRPFTRGMHGKSLQNLYSVLVDTLLGSAEQLDECLKIMGTLEAETIILAGRADGVITHEVIESQARTAAKLGRASAPVFRSYTTHAGFLAPAGREYVANIVSMSDHDLAQITPAHYLVA